MYWKTLEVEVSVISDKDSVVTTAQSTIEKVSAKNNIGVSVQKVDDKQKFDTAKELNLTVNKLTAVTEYSDAVGGSVKDNAYKLKDKTLNEIKDMSAQNLSTSTIYKKQPDFILYW